MKKTEAIKQSLEKWVRICESTTPALQALNHCPLCRQYLKTINPCYHCPLYLSNQGCLDLESVWGQINMLLSPLRAIDCESPLTIFSLNDLELTSLCCQMRDTLQDLYDNEKDVPCSTH